MVACKNQQFLFYKNIFRGSIKKVTDQLYNPADNIFVYSTILKIVNDFNIKSAYKKND